MRGAPQCDNHGHPPDVAAPTGGRNCPPGEARPTGFSQGVLQSLPACSCLTVCFWKTWPRTDGKRKNSIWGPVSQRSVRASRFGATGLTDALIRFDSQSRPRYYIQDSRDGPAYHFSSSQVDHYTPGMLTTDEYRTGEAVLECSGSACAALRGRDPTPLPPPLLRLILSLPDLANPKSSAARDSSFIAETWR